MSHITKLQFQRIPFLRDLKRAVEMFPELVFNEGQTKHLFYGNQKGDCLHAISVKNKPDAYEIGVIADGDGFGLQWDSYAGGKGMVNIVGQDMAKLKQEISVQIAVRNLSNQGFFCTRQEQPNGDIRIHATQ